MSATRPPARQVLVDSGLRVTAPRVAVLETLATAPHATADQIASEVRGRLGTVSTQAIYDALRTFEEHSLVRRIEPAGSPARYETRTGDNHHHLVCRVCGKVTDVDCVVGHAPCLEPVHSAGYILDEAEVVFWGICPDCQQKAKATQTQIKVKTAPV